MKEKGLVFGAGFLGTIISKELGYKLEKLNVLDLKALATCLDKEKPDIVVNAVGMTGRPNIDWCESNKEETIMGNVIAASNLCIESTKRRIYFVHLGSGCIYQGDNNGKGFSEEDEPTFYGPQFYAKSKILAEKILKEFPCLQIRLRMPTYNKPHERNFIDKVKKYSRVINAQNSTTVIPDMIKALKILISKKCTGIYNMTNPGTISAAEVMQMYKEIVDPKHKFEIFSLEELDKAVVAKRSNCYLNTDKLKNEGIELPEIHEAVRKCLLDYKKHTK